MHAVHVSVPLEREREKKNQHCMPRHVSILVSLVESPCIHLFFSGVPTRARMSGTQCSHQQTLHTSCTHFGYILFHLLPTGSQIFKRDVPPGKMPNGRRSAKWNLSVYLVKAAGRHASAETTGNDIVKRLRYNTIICIRNCKADLVINATWWSLSSVTSSWVNPMRLTWR